LTIGRYSAGGLSFRSAAADISKGMPSPRSARRRDGSPEDDRARAVPPELEAKSLIDKLPAIVYVAEVGVDGTWHYVSSGAEAILGFSPEEWMADPGLWARQIHPDDRARVFDREDELDEPAVPEEYRMRHRDGATVWVRDEAALVSDAQGRVLWHGVLSDITGRKLAEAELERRAEQQAAVARLGKHALEGAEVAALMHDALKEATRILDVKMGAVLEQPSNGGAPILRAGLGLSPALGLVRGQRVAKSRLRNGVTGQIESRDSSWGILWLAVTPERPLGPTDIDFVQALANILADAIQQRATEDDIRYQALHDPLTGLPNRVLFLDRLGHALARPGAEVAVVLLDIDNFKLVNDSLGHSAGDKLLMEIAPRLKTALGPGDTIARLGGDEFVVLLEQIPDERSAARVAERIVAVFDLPFDLYAGEHFAKASLGIALAKNDLRRALERDELCIAYQPIVSLQDGSLVSVEALLRWQHPTRGLLSPAEFIPVAGESGLIEPIGRWVMDAACMQGAHWHAGRPDSRPLGICVNLSVRQFNQRDLEATVANALALAGIEPSTLCLEITESVLLEESEKVSETITGVARHGVRFALDDFGTGYSSLAYLTRLPIDALKVDRSFVAALGSDSRSTAITTAIVRMAQALSIDVIAEGVETASQVDALRGLRCELAQGFYFHRPLTAQAVSELLGPRRPGRATRGVSLRPRSPVSARVRSP
jgi:diguanylate cyclase (GGDEF)-like protein/PAS domain S-box-containing protein